MWLRIIRDIEYFLLDENYSTLGMCPKVYPRKLILREVPHENKKVLCRKSCVLHSLLVSQTGLTQETHFFQ